MKWIFVESEDREKNERFYVHRVACNFSSVCSQRPCGRKIESFRLSRRRWFRRPSCRFHSKYWLFSIHQYFQYAKNWIFFNNEMFGSSRKLVDSAPQICPHLPWQSGFYIFGIIGILWTTLWMILYPETNAQDEIPMFVPKVKSSLSKSGKTSWSVDFLPWKKKRKNWELTLFFLFAGHTKSNFKVDRVHCALASLGIVYCAFCNELE